MSDEVEAALRAEIAELRRFLADDHHGAILESRDSWEDAYDSLRLGCKCRGLNPDEVEREGREYEAESARREGRGEEHAAYLKYLGR